MAVSKAGQHVTFLVTVWTASGTNQNASIHDQFSLHDFGRELPTTFASNPKLNHRQNAAQEPIGHCWFYSSYTMGIWDTFTDLVEAVTPWSVVEAEAPPAAPQVSHTGYTPCDLIRHSCQPNRLAPGDGRHRQFKYSG